MSYQALYRVWRPQTFDELVGQDLIKTTLKNAVKNDQLSHAYLFTGPRGTGKTSVAKILAKAVNCPNQTDGNPCNECEMCERITQGELSDVVEIDAASNNGVDEIRDLRENVRYAAVQAKYKVYIIDEVHMLTTGAFNALLKTLEEPPERVIFILATTEPHKVPATIISRTQRFDFKRIQMRDIVQRLEEVLQTDKHPYDKDALTIIARAANGGLRDALGILDQALSYSEGTLTVDLVLEISGSLSQQVFVEYLVAVNQADSGQALEIIQRQFQQGKQASRFIEELTLFIRDVLLTRHSHHNYTLLRADELKPLDAVTTEYLYHVIDQLSEAQQRMRFSNQPDIHAEVMTIELAVQPSAVSTSDAPGMTADDKGWVDNQVATLQEEIAFLRAKIEGQDKQITALIEQQTAIKESGVSTTRIETNPAPTETGAKRLTPRPRPHNVQNTYLVNEQDVYYVLNQATKEDLQRWREHWEDILSQLAIEERRLFDRTQVRAAGGGYVLVTFTNQLYCGTVQNQASIRHQIESRAEELFGLPERLIALLDSDWPLLRRNYVALHQAAGGPVPLPDYTPPPIESHANQLNKLETPDVVDEELPTIQQVIDSPEQELIMNEDPVDPVAPPEFVQKAIDLFGAENINIIEE